MPAKTTETKPTHEQAQLLLQVYDQRRETRLREARDWFFKNYFVNSMEDSMRIAAPGTETTELALVGGRPVQGEVLFSGPFVMDTPERLAQAKRDFAAGRMGRLEGVPY